MTKLYHPSRGTEGSNPASSSAESGTNRTLGPWPPPRLYGARVKAAVSYGGTDGSNPVPSTGESTANLIGCGRPLRGRPVHGETEISNLVCSSGESPANLTCIHQHLPDLATAK